MRPIRIDTSELTYPWLWIPGRLPRFVDGSVRDGAEVHLPAGAHAVQQTRTRASDVRFSVTEDGVVDYPSAHAAVLTGRGTPTLRVRGVEITLEPVGRARPLLPLWGGCREPLGARVRSLRIPPGSGYVLRLLHTPREVVEFHVRADGSVDFPSVYDGALSGRGTAVLTLDLDRLHAPRPGRRGHARLAGLARSC
jgi:hypothetical protein